VQDLEGSVGDVGNVLYRPGVSNVSGKGPQMILWVG